MSQEEVCKWEASSQYENDYNDHFALLRRDVHFGHDVHALEGSDVIHCPLRGGLWDAREGAARRPLCVILLCGLTLYLLAPPVLSCRLVRELLRLCLPATAWRPHSLLCRAVQFGLARSSPNHRRSCPAV